METLPRIDADAPALPDSTTRRHLHLKLSAAALPESVPGSLPVLFFGDLFKATVATLALNPSSQEYLDRAGRELEGGRRRFASLGFLGASDRQSLSDDQRDEAVRFMRDYFRPGKPVLPWFNPIEGVLSGMGCSYVNGSAAHLDLVQEPTRVPWSSLTDEVRRTLLRRDEPFLVWQLTTFPIDCLVCNGATPLAHALRLLGGQVDHRHVLGRLTWTTATGSVGGRKITIVGWNIPMTRATGLDPSGRHELGRLLRSTSLR